MFRVTIRDVLWLTVGMWVAWRIKYSQLQFEIARNDANLAALKSELVFQNGMTSTREKCAAPFGNPVVAAVAVQFGGRV